ncbi:MAG: hypothetical protein M3R17_15355 [Bacteroidota bacterium]|nr:hypothetical protein [Bacteroidota bacterium]
MIFRKQIECPSCSKTVSQDEVPEEELICECGYLMLPFEFGIQPLTVVRSEAEISKCS